MNFIQMFLDETRGQLKALNVALLALSQDYFNHDKINAAFRILHTMKGAASLVKQNRIEALVHDAETYLDDLRAENLKEAKFFVLAILKLNNQLRLAMQALEQQHGLSAQTNAAATENELRPLQDMLKIVPIFVKDLSLNLGKQIDIEIRADDFLLTAAASEKINTFIVQLINNAADHGIENVAQRLRQHKPATGLIKLVIAHNNHAKMLTLTVTDDGQGIDFNRLRVLAAERSLYNDNINALSDAKLVDYIFRPGLSTMREVSKISGRGVGLDIIKTTLAQMQGTIEVASWPGRGTMFTLKIPYLLTDASQSSQQQLIL